MKDGSGKINWRRVVSVMRKEWWHITRDKMSFTLLLVSPVLVLITMGYAFSIDIKNVSIAVLDHDRSLMSRQYINQISSTDALRLEAFPENLEDVDRLMMRGDVKAVIIIPKGFARDLQSGDTAAVQVIVDGTDPNTAGHAIKHVGAHTENFAAAQMEAQLLKAGYAASMEAPIDLRIRPWYNPSLRYTVSMIPALVGVVLSVPAMAASLALSREREWGTLEGLIATPIGRFELILGKIIPYVLAGLLSVPLCVLTAVYLYNVTFQGSFLLYMLLALVFLFATMSMAMLISVFIKSQQAAIMASMMIFLFSGFFMSGLLIPFALMGPLLQMEALLLPTTHFVIISRSIFVKGAGLAELRGFAIALLAIGLIFFVLTSLMFKKKL
jgi:ABC-2 type transport system permease protein